MSLSRTKQVLDSRSNLERKFSVEGRYFMPSERKCFCNLLHKQLCEKHLFFKKEEKKVFLFAKLIAVLPLPCFSQLVLTQ